jgi:AraC-like DNA-binding protein/ligand-binding sensor protein
MTTEYTLYGLTDQLVEVIDSFAILTGVPVTFFTRAGEMKREWKAENKLCPLSDLYLAEDSICTDNLKSSARIAETLGEPYVFLCRAGFTKIAISLIIDGKIMGYFMAGPIAMGRISESMIDTIYNINALHEFPGKIPKLTLFLKSMKVITPKEVAHLANILHGCVLSKITLNEDYMRISKNYKEQAKIGEDVLSLKKKHLSLLYPYPLEKELMHKVKSGDAEKAQELMQTLLNEVLLIEAGNLDLVKTTMLEVCAVLSRAAVEGGASLQQIFEKDFNYINSINGAESVQDLRMRTAELVLHFSQNVFDNLYLGNSKLIGQAVKYVNANYMTKLSLKSLAISLHINPSYLSMHFKREMGINFTDYLNDVRIKRSKDLLITTNLSLLDISLQTGFEEQSYFTKVFKKLAGITPNQYRKKILQGK